jgi:xylulose-5-phosphate/fructose-6-phosphate phosphoketolase
MPGLNFIYVQLNRVIKKQDLDMDPRVPSRARGTGDGRQYYLEGTYSELYPYVSQDAERMQRLFIQS